MWPVMTFYTNSAIHMLAHGAWAQMLMFAGAAELALVRGKLQSQRWRLAMPAGFLVSGTALLVHEQNPWFFSALVVPPPPDAGGRSSSARSSRSRRGRETAVEVCRDRLRADVRRRLPSMLYSDRDVAPVFGHLSPLAGAAAPMKRLALAAVLVALAFPGAGLAHATLLHDAPGFRQRLATLAAARHA